MKENGKIEQEWRLSQNSCGFCATGTIRSNLTVKHGTVGQFCHANYNAIKPVLKSKRRTTKTSSRLSYCLFFIVLRKLCLLVPEASIFMNALNDFIAGWFGGCAGVVVGQPLDTVKVRMQAAYGKGKATKTLNFKTVFSSTVENESVSGLFKGMVPPLTAVAIQNAILFGVYGNTLKLFKSQSDGSYSASQVAFAGSLAGLAQCFIICPLDLVKVKLQMQTEAKRVNSLYRGSLDCLQKIFKARGLAGCFQGFSVVLLRDVPGFGVYFGTYELFTHWLSKITSQGSVLVPLIAGGLSGVVSWVSTFPLDVIKSRVQADGNLGYYRYSGFLDCAVKSYRSEGLVVFTRGLLPAILRAFPTNAAIFYVHGLVLKILHKKDQIPSDLSLVEEQ